MSGVVCAWLRNDLRLYDSPVLHRAVQLSKERGLPTLPVYVLDPRHFQRTKHGSLKTGAVRALFLLQSVRCLKRQLRKLGSDLLIAVGRPEEVLPPLLGNGSVLLTQEEVTFEELRVDGELQQALVNQSVQWQYCWGSTLYHKEDLPFRADLKDAPDVFTLFKNKVEPELAASANEVPATFQGEKKLQSDMNVRPCLPEPEAGSLPLPPLLGKELFEFEPSWQDLPFQEEVAAPTEHQGAAMRFEGGEEAGLARLQHYLFDTDLIRGYFEVRNGMLGPDYSTKLAPWLALGCVSPRKVYEQVREYEKARVANKSTYWVLFELMWRDFYKFFAAKHGNAIFKLHGLTGKERAWRPDSGEFFRLWTDGLTGYPLIDANMRELKATGFMSNRGRQNVASFLALDMKLDWRRGADWFESLLVDHDVASNWGNWVHAAGLTTGRINHFNVIKQSKSYDKEGMYLKHWLPELQNVPSSLIHEPWTMSDEERERFGAGEYPAPCVDPTTFREDANKGQGKGPPKVKGPPWTKGEKASTG
ncbi:unnamed protein product [Polarella glacialis]|uniref:Cryptochrome DASH n=1 Tax=Polarella glacialis TaxID=89957 RepID=A0A813H3K4_POLGL|nr:unnamed protein product [Polarella glacialis]CAE8686713.1 unnamed protein product [Polarella glacialis]